MDSENSLLPTVVYIAGYSRSGSTLLDITLGNHPEVSSTGEIVYFLEDVLNTARCCTCGVPYQRCEFWSPFLSRYTSEDIRRLLQIQRLVESRENFAKLRTLEFPFDIKAAYKEFHRELFLFLAKKSKSRFVVDSSKSARDAAGRYLALCKIAEIPVKVIHLVRNARNTVYSYTTQGSNWELEGYKRSSFLRGPRAVFGWTLANRIAAYGNSLLEEENYFLLRQEDLLADPAYWLNRIGDFCDLDFQELAEQAANCEPMKVCHNVGGNRLRLASEIRFRKNSEINTIPRLPLFTQIVFNIVAKKMNKSFYH